MLTKAKPKINRKSRKPQAFFHISCMRHKFLIIFLYLLLFLVHFFNSATFVVLSVRMMNTLVKLINCVNSFGWKYPIFLIVSLKADSKAQIYKATFASPLSLIEKHKILAVMDTQRPLFPVSTFTDWRRSFKI